MPDAMDIWRAGAPQIDIFGVDVYSFDFVRFCAKVQPIRQPAVHPRDGGGRGGPRPERSTPSDATTPSASRPCGALTGMGATDYDLIAATICSRNWRP